MTIESILQRDVRTCRPTDSLASAAHVLWDGDCGFLPVLDDEDRVVGTVTDRDLCMGTLFQGKSMDQVLVREVMAKQVFRVGPKTSIVEVLTCLRERQLRRLPVVDDEGRLVGLVTLADVARAWSTCKDLGGRVLSADDVARTVAGILTSRDAAPTATLVVEFTPPERTAKPAKRAAKKASKKKSANKSAKKKASKASKGAKKKDAGKAEPKKPRAKSAAKRKPAKKDSPPVVGGLFSN